MLPRMLCVFVALWFAASSAAAARAATSEATPTGGAIASQQVIDVPDGLPFALSPDGSRLGVWQRGDEPKICAYDIAKLAIERCAAYAGASVESGSGVWSPDGTRLAFTENGIRFFDETDIWVFDAESGALTDLTDDGKSGGGLSATLGTGIPLDFAPAWSPDGTELVFARGMKTGENASGDDIETTTLERIRASGGEPVAVAKVADRRQAVVAGIRWLADGAILYTVAQPGDDLVNGLWRIAPDGSAPEQLTASGDAVLVDVAAGKHALLMDDSGAFLLADLASGDIQPLETTGPSGARILAATFSPDGSRLLIETRDGLAVRNLADGTDQPLGKPDHMFAPSYGQSGLDWAPNGVVFGPIEANWGQVLRLSGV